MRFRAPDRPAAARSACLGAMISEMPREGGGKQESHAALHLGQRCGAASQAMEQPKAERLQIDGAGHGFGVHQSVLALCFEVFDRVAHGRKVEIIDSAAYQPVQLAAAAIAPKCEPNRDGFRMLAREADIVRDEALQPLFGANPRRVHEGVPALGVESREHAQQFGEQRLFALVVEYGQRRRQLRGLGYGVEGGAAQPFRGNERHGRIDDLLARSQASLAPDVDLRLAPRHRGASLDFAGPQTGAHVLGNHVGVTLALWPSNRRCPRAGWRTPVDCNTLTNWLVWISPRVSP